MKKKSFFIAIILILTVIMLTGCKNNNIDSLKLEINKIFEYAHLYLSNGDTILLYVENYENDRDTEKLSQIMDLLKSSIEKGKFNKFKKLEVITYLSENELMIKDIYNDYMDGTELLNEFIGL